jgi:RimJ/RimL family protein N-acetyltransferase
MQLIKLTPSDVDRFLAFRAIALVGDPDSFRFAPDDDAAVGTPAWRDRLGRDHVVVVERGSEWLGVAGLTRFSGAKLDHKGLVWGMYVVPEARGTGVADLLMAALIEHATGRLRQLQLTVMADNIRAQVFYAKHGFVVYGVERDSVRRPGSFADETLMWRLVKTDGAASRAG